MIRRPPRSTLFPLHDALPIWRSPGRSPADPRPAPRVTTGETTVDITMPKWGMSMQEGVLTGWIVAVGDEVAEGQARSEEHTSELQSRQYLVCRLLLEKKK